MNRQPVESSNIRSIGHDGSFTLEIEFKDGSVYQYFDVPRSVYDELLMPMDGSVGKCFNSLVKGVYRYAKL